MLVAFLHGLGRTRWSMEPMRRHVAAAGFRTWARTYPSRRLRLGELGSWVAQELAEAAAAGPVVAVTHSMGGVVARCAPVPWAGLCMLAPPSAGSRLAARVGPHPVGRLVLGTAGQELAEAAQAGLALPAPPPGSVVVGGTRDVALANPASWLSRPLRLHPGASDGTLGLDEVAVEGVRLVTVHRSHSGLILAPEVWREVVGWLRTVEEGS